MTKKIFRSILTVAGTILVISIALIIGVMYNFFTKEHVDMLKGHANFVASSVNKYGTEILHGLSDDKNRITLIQPDGTVSFDNTADITSMDNHLNREEVQEALDKGEGECKRFSSSLSEMTYYYAILLDNGAVLRVSASQFGIISLLTGMVQPFAIIIFLGVILSITFAMKAAKSIVQPINELSLEESGKVEVYEELTPLVNRIATQNKLIHMQVNELKKKQREFTVMTDNMQEGFILLDKAGHLLSYNSAAMRILKFSANQSSKDFLKQLSNIQLRDSICEVFEGKHREIAYSETQITYHAIINPVFQEKEIVGAVIVVTDVTEKEQREQFRREFSANVSHELKTPLTTISGTAEIMKNGLVKQEDIPHFADNIYRESKRLIALVEDIIKISQLDEDSTQKKWEETNLYELTHEVVSELMLSATSREITLECISDLKELENVEVYTVKHMAQEIIYNLCDNAIKYNKDGGYVRIGIRENSENITISVEDNGIGIPKEEQGRVFERFYRVDKSHSKTIGGTGLGLSIVKHSAAYLGASIHLTSEPGEGTTITVSFPK